MVSKTDRDLKTDWDSRFSHFHGIRSHFWLLHRATIRHTLKGELFNARKTEKLMVPKLPGIIDFPHQGPDVVVWGGEFSLCGAFEGWT